MTFRIAQISDTHLSDTRPFFVDNFLCIGEAIRRTEPDLVLNSGDISLDGAGQEDDLAAARRLHDGLGLPMRFLPGNHDLGDSQDSPGHGEAHIDAERRERYVRHFGPDWWSFDVPGWRVIGINAQLVGSDLKAAEDQHAAVGDAVIGLGRRKLALFLHKPLFDQTAEETDVSHRFVTPVSRRLLLADLGAATPSLVVCGHVHQFRDTRLGDTQYVWGPSTGFILPDHRQPRYGLKEVGYVEHRLYEDGSHDSAMVRVPGAPTVDITTLPRIYGPT